MFLCSPLELQNAGNKAFQCGKHTEAVEHYTAAILNSVESRPFAAVCFCNRAAAHQALGKISDAIADCSLAIALDGSYIKVCLWSLADLTHLIHGLISFNNLSRHFLEGQHYMRWSEIMTKRLTIYGDSYLFFKISHKRPVNSLTFHLGKDWAKKIYKKLVTGFLLWSEKLKKELPWIFTLSCKFLNVLQFLELSWYFSEWCFWDYRL